MGEIGKLYLPLFQEMEQFNKTLNLEEFLVESEKIYMQLSKSDRDLFLSSYDHLAFKVSYVLSIA